MKISELVNQLVDLAKKHGDLEVLAHISSPNGGAFAEIEAAEAADENTVHKTERFILLTGAE